MAAPTSRLWFRLRGAHPRVQMFVLGRVVMGCQRAERARQDVMQSRIVGAHVDRLAREGSRGVVAPDGIECVRQRTERERVAGVELDRVLGLLDRGLVSARPP